MTLDTNSAPFLIRIRMTLDTNSAPFLVSKFSLKLVQLNFGLKLILGTPARPLKVSKRDYLLKRREDARASLPPRTTVAILLASPWLNRRRRRCPAAPKAPRRRSLCCRDTRSLPADDRGARGRRQPTGVRAVDGG